MALTKAEQTELDDLRKRATTAEANAKESAEAADSANTAAAAANEAANNANEANALLTTANDDANVKLADAAIEKADAIEAALEAQAAELQLEVDRAGGKVDKSVSPAKPTKFNPGAYFSECHGADVAKVQNGWFYDHDNKAVRPVNKPSK